MLLVDILSHFLLCLFGSSLFSLNEADYRNTNFIFKKITGFIDLFYHFLSLLFTFFLVFTISFFLLTLGFVLSFSNFLKF